MAPTSGPLWVIVPTYNEAPNLESLLGALRKVLPRAGRILVVDDASPDGTGQIAERLAGELEEVAVLHRQRREGLGPAYLDAFRRALDGGADLVLQMDADFSHDPAYVPRLLEATRNADLVLGSRYVPGGGVSDWGPLRRMISRGGSAYARAALGLEIRDLTGGFKCWRRSALESIDLESVTSRGYAFQVEMTYRAIRAGLRVAEVPIVFRDRRGGSSKMGGAIVAEAVWRVPALRFSVQTAHSPSSKRQVA
jgi:dolichol-phosphate mannosyltransferase